MLNVDRKALTATIRKQGFRPRDFATTSFQRCGCSVLRLQFRSSRLLFEAIETAKDSHTFYVHWTRFQPGFQWSVRNLEEVDVIDGSSLSNDLESWLCSEVRPFALQEDLSSGRKHVFLSYCHDDADDAGQLHDDLIAAGERVRWDRDILPGVDWKTEIHRSIQQSYAVVLGLSKRLTKRIESGVYPEVADAIEVYRRLKPGNIFLIPVRFSACEIPNIAIDSTRSLSELQYADLFPASRRSAGFQALLHALRAVPWHP